MLRSAIILTALTLTTCSPPTPPPQPGAPDAPVSATVPTSWTVNPGLSQISFVSIKSGAIGESHQFAGLSGSFDNDGVAVISIALDTVETGIDIRNERMREHLFETETFATATITAQLSPVQFQALQVGQRETINLQISLDLHGHEVGYDVPAYVTRLDTVTVIVSSTMPVILNAGDFDLLGGIETLRNLASLPEITPVVSVSFSITFDGAD